MRNEISSLELNELLGKINLIDIRDTYTYDIVHIIGSKNIEASELVQYPSKYLKEGSSYYLYCDFGLISKKVCGYLNDLGYDCISITDGFNGYNKIKKR